MVAAQRSRLVESGHDWPVAAFAAGVVVSLSGAAALAGWFFDIPLLKALFPGSTPMAPSAALLFIAHGAMLALYVWPKAGRHAANLCRLIAALSAIVAALLLVFSIADVQSPIEHLGFAIAHGVADTPPPGHISPFTAASFLLASVTALIIYTSLYGRSMGRLVAGASASLLIGASFLLFLAYLYGKPLLYGGSFIPPAANTTLAFVILGAGFFAVGGFSTTSAAPFAGDSRVSAWFLLIFVLLTAGMVAAGHIYYQGYERRFRSAMERKLAAIADLKVRELTHWRQERLADGAVFTGATGFTRWVERCVDALADRTPCAEVAAWLSQTRRVNSYDRVALLDARGVELVSAPAAAERPTPRLSAAVKEALRTRRVTFLDFYRAAPNRPVRLSVIAPIFGRGARPRALGAVVLRIDPTTRLYPTIQRWPTASETAETLIVRRDGDEVQFLNELRFDKDAALSLRIPMSSEKVPAVKAARGYEGNVDGIDYRGAEVLAAVRTVPDSPWLLVARMDAREVFAPLAEPVWIMVALVMALVLTAGGLLAFAWRRLSNRFFREKHEAEDRLEEHERLLKNISDNMFDMVAMADMSGRFIYASPSHRQLGYEPTQLLGHLVYEHVHDDDRALVLDEIMKGAQSGAARKLEYRYQRATGDYVWLESIGKFIEDGDRALAGMIISSRDITAVKRYERTLREEKERAQQYVDVAAVILVGRDSDGRVTLINRRGCEVLGVKDPRQIEGRDWLEFIPSDEHFDEIAMHRALMNGEIEAHRREEGRLLAREGGSRMVVWHNALLRDPQGEVVGTLASGEDVTEQRALEAQLAQSDRLSSMGMLAAGIAHEIKNPLSYLLYNLESLKEDLPALLGAVRRARDRLGHGDASSAAERELAGLTSPDALDDILGRFDDALSGSHRIRDVARSLGTFSRVEKDQIVPVNLAHVMDVAADMAFNEIRYRARLVKDYGEVPDVLASEGRLSQVFLNLIINATHAIDEGVLDKNEIRLRTWAEDDVACAEVRDTGSGIAPHNLDKLFDPFFSTKKVGFGSGLGLSISKSIIESYGGRIRVQSEEGKGTSVTLELPCHAELAPVDRSAASPSLASETKGRILVVDDEKGIRSAMARMLREHETLLVSGGAEAKALLQADHAFDLVLCDMMMPDVSGMDLHEWLMIEHPALARRLIFVSGGAFTPRAKEYLSNVGNLRVEKPFDTESFKKLVNERVALAKHERAV